MKTQKTSNKKLKSRKTKILAIGDIHGDSRLTKRLAEKAVKENVDLVILAGDLTLMEMSTKNIVGPFVKAGKQVLLIPGNHESVATANFLADLYPGTKNIHGYAIKMNDLGIFGAGGANIGLNYTSDKEIYRLLKQGNDQLQGIQKKIMVTHMHPKGTMLDKISPHFPGSTGIKKAIEKFRPDFAIFAHMHETPGLEEKMGKTRVINVSRKEKIFEI